VTEEDSLLGLLHASLSSKISNSAVSSRRPLQAQVSSRGFPFNSNSRERERDERSGGRALIKLSERSSLRNSVKREARIVKRGLKL
jgi:hypothetical protein